MIYGVLQVLQGVQQRAVHVKQHGPGPGLSTQRQQVGQQDAPQNQNDAQIPRACHPLMEQRGPENGGKGRAQGAEQAGPICADMALGHGLQGIAKAGTHHRQDQDDAPLAARLGQAG